MYQQLQTMSLIRAPCHLRFKSSDIFGNQSRPLLVFRLQTPTNFQVKTLVAKRRANTRKESPKIRNRRMLKKEAAERLGEELIRACGDLKINEISYDRNGFARGERMRAFEVAISRHGFLPR